MKNRFLVPLGVFVALLISSIWQPSRADLGFWSAHLVGVWQHPKNGDVYEFRSNATYIFHAGPGKRKSGNLSHRGFWKIAPPRNPQNLEGPVSLVLKSRFRTVLEGKQSRELRANRHFVLDADTVQDDQMRVNPHFYRIDRAKWKRIR